MGRTRTRRGEQRPKPVFVTAFFRHHGLAFFDMLLRAFGHDPGIADRLMDPGAPPIDPVSQFELTRRPTPNDLPFDQVVLLVPRALEARWVGTYNRQLRDTRLLDSVRAEGGDANVVAWFERMRDLAEHKALTLAAARDLNHDRVAERWLWQIVHELPLEDQVTWWRANSPWRDHPKVKLEAVGPPSGLGTDDPKGWASAVQQWLRGRDRGERYLVNLYGTATDNHLAWYYLAWRSPRLKDAVFCECATLHDGKGKPRFRPIRFARASKDLLSELSKVGTRPSHQPSKERDRARRRLELYRDAEDHFVILVLGERGTGKSSTVEDAFKKPGRPFESANCANFQDAGMAHSMLFGHVQGAFTGATSDQDGLFALADGGTLFLDEFHKLPDQIRDRLLTALTPDDKGRFTFTPLGGKKRKKVSFQLVLGSNEKLDKLRAAFPEDFWDRVHQRVVVLPPFDKQAELERSWTKVWERMAFTAPAFNPLGDEDLHDRFLSWLNSLEFPGNFRDLERLAIRTADLQREEERDLLDPVAGAEAPLWFAHLRRQWAAEEDSAAATCMARRARAGQGHESPVGVVVESSPEELNFVDDPTLTPTIAIRRFRKRMAAALTNAYGNRAKAAVEMKRRDGRTDQSTIGRWLKAKETDGRRGRSKRGPPTDA